MRTRTAFSATAVLALVGALVLGGALSASAAPDALIVNPTAPAVTYGSITFDGQIDWGTSGGFVAVDVVNEDNVTTSFCEDSVYAATDTEWSCPGVMLSIGENTLTARADDGAGQLVSGPTVVTFGGSDDPVINGDGTSYTGATGSLSGTGPKMGTVTLFGYPTATGSPPGQQFCTNIPVNSSGVWNCEVTVAALDRYSFYATGADILGNNTFASPTVQMSFNPSKPTLAVTSTPDTLSVQATTGTLGENVGVRGMFYINSADIGTPIASCPAGWSYSTPPTSGSPVDCDLSDPASGSFLVTSNSFTNGAYSADRSDLIRIPNVPVLLGGTPDADGTVTFSGTQSPLWSSPFATIDGGSEVTVQTASGLEICTAVPNPGNDWSCTGAAPGGTQQFNAYATSVNFAGSPASLDGYWDGTSQTSSAIEVSVPEAQHVQLVAPANGSTVPWQSGDNLVISGTSNIPGTVDVAVNGEVPFNCSGIAVTAGAWTCAVPADPGSYTLVASQAGSLDDTASTQISTPAPAFYNDDPYQVERNGVAEFFGTSSFLNDTTHIVLGSTGRSCDDAPDDTGFWQCDIDLTGLALGSYTATGTLVYGAAVQESSTLQVEIVQPGTLPGQPVVDCQFTPGAAHITAGTGVDASVWAVNPGTGGGLEQQGFCNGNNGSVLSALGPWDEGPIATCAPTCTLTTPAGSYDVYYEFGEGDESGTGQFDYIFTVPATPALSAVSATGVASGSGTAGNTVRVVTPADATLCTTVVQGAGTWSCTVPQTATAGQARAFEIDSASGAMSTYSATLAIPAVVPVTPVTPAKPAPTPSPTPTPTPTPTPSETPSTPGEWTFEIIGRTGDTIEPGQKLTLSGSDLIPTSGVVAELHSDPITLGTTDVDDDGNFSMDVTIPATIDLGQHEIVVIVTPPGGVPTVATAPVTVTESGSADSSEQGGTITPGSAARSEPGADSALTVGFVSPAEILNNPLAVVTAGSLGLALVLLVLVPAEFFGEALANHYGSMGGFLARRKRLRGVVERVHEWVEANRFLAGAALVFVTSVVFCFVDPGFGFDLTSLRLLLSCAASILLVNFLSAGVTERIAEKAWKVPTRLEVMPWGLAIAVVGVLASRLLDFSPGFLIGSIIGVSVVGEVSKKLEMRVILLWSVVVWAVAMLSWVIAPLIPVLTPTDPASFVVAFVSDSLVATSAAGLTALLVALLPIALFDGGELFKHSKLRWALAFGIAVASFAIVVLPSASNWLGLGDGLLTWLLLTLGFIALAIVTYLFAVRRNGLGRSRLLKGTENSAEQA